MIWPYNDILISSPETFFFVVSMKNKALLCIFSQYFTDFLDISELNTIYLMLCIKSKKTKKIVEIFLVVFLQQNDQ